MSGKGQEMAWLLRKSYILWCLGKLPAESERKNERVARNSNVDWKQSAQKDLGLPPTAIRSLWAILSEHLDNDRALVLLLRTFQCESDAS